MADRLRVREIDDDEGRRLVRIVRRGSGSVVTWRRAQMVLLSAPGMDAAAIAKVAFTSEDRVRDVIRDFNADGFSSLYPKYKDSRPPKFSLSFQAGPARCLRHVSGTFSHVGPATAAPRLQVRDRSSAVQRAREVRLLAAGHTR